MFFSILLCLASMPSWKGSSRRLRRYILLDGSKQVSLIIPLNLAKRKNHNEQGQVNRGVVPARQCSSRPRTAGCWKCCREEAATMCPAKILAFSCTLSEDTPRDLLVDLLIDHQPLWQEFTVDDASSNIEECDRHDLVLLSHPSLNLLCYTKTSVHGMLLSPFQVLLMEFSLTGPKIWFIRSSSAHSWTIWKKGVNKSMLKKNAMVAKS